MPALAQEGRAVACVSCVVLDVPVEAVASLLPERGSLAGLTVVVRPASSLTDLGTPVLQQVIAQLGAAGARPGLVVPAGSLPPRLAPGLSLAIVDPPPGPDPDSRVFAARTAITTLRAASPGIEIGVEPETFNDAGVPFDRLRPYVDAELRRVLLPASPTLDDLIAASLAPGGERVRAVAHTVDWTAVSAFVARGATAVDVTAARGLTADEIVARHQVRRRRTEAIVASSISRGTTTVLLEVPGFVAPVTITARTTIYARGDIVDVEQEDIRVNGAAITGGPADRAPRLPLVEPERISEPPLHISLTDAYIYDLEGTDAIDGTRAFVVAFAPRVSRSGLPRGRAWIDAADFSLRRLQLTQDELRGPIVSSEQVQDFMRVPAGEGNVDLPADSRIYQMYEGAGHRTPIHRVIDVQQHEINPPDFDERLRAAHASSHLIIRETPEGVRYVGDPGTTIRTAVLGVLVDPNITEPLPFAGVSYVNFDVRGTGAQLNVFFGGSYGQLSWSVPSLAGTRWQLHGQAFAIAARYNDRAFTGGAEQYAENIRQRPAHISTGAIRPLSPRLRARLDYELDITAFDRSDTTAAAFEVPANAVVHGFLAAIEGERGPWSARAWWNPARRQRWRAWGFPGRFDARTRDFGRYGASLARTIALHRSLGSRLEATWMDGHDLDRFSRAIVNSFDNRVHGYPTASIRYDRGIVARSATSWTRRGWRLDGFADLAVVRDPGFGEALRGYPGVGAALESAGPFRTLLSVEWGYGFKGRRRDGGMGTQAVRITAYRMF